MNSFPFCDASLAVGGLTTHFFCVCANKTLFGKQNNGPDL